MAGESKRTEGLADRATGRVKEAAGDLTGNRDMQQEGERTLAKGKAKGAVGKVQDKVDDVKDKVTS
jgi:uncharacterized protein YjbJ (UPF0337 family)